MSEITVAGVRYRLHSFLAVGSHSFVVLDPGSHGLIEYLVVGGGGGGGANRGGGGGAGALRSNWGGALISLSSGSYTVVVGRGGKGAISPLPGGSQNSSKPGKMEKTLTSSISLQLVADWVAAIDASTRLGWKAKTGPQVDLEEEHQSTI